MAARLVPGSPKSVDISELKFGDVGAPRRRRAAMAFAAGSVLFLTSAAAMISNGASAQGPGQGLFGAIFASSSAGIEGFSPYGSGRLGDARSGFIQLPLGPPDNAGKRNRSHSASRANDRKSHPVSVANFGSRRPVCVRLCDGFFFPASEPVGASDAAAEEAACSGLCPDAPMAVFYQPSGSDKIEDAFSAAGQRYTDLPIALRYRSTQDNTCSCHRSFASALSPLHDPTLRKGDALMTPNGILVFRGVEQATHTSQDFSALAAAPLPKDQRTTLRALERVSQAPQRGVTRAWVAAETAPPVETATKTAASEITDKIRFVERPD